MEDDDVDDNDDDGDDAGDDNDNDDDDDDDDKGVDIVELQLVIAGLFKMRCLI